VALAFSDQEKIQFDESMRAEYARRFLFYKPYEQQMKFHAAEQIAQELLFLAGNRTGKTFCASTGICIHLTGMYPEWWPGYRYKEPADAWVVGPTNLSVRDTLQKQYYLGDPDKGTIGLLHPSLIIDQKRGRGVADQIDTVYVRHVPSGGISKLTFKSAEQGRKKFQGDKKHLIHIDEECPIEIYKECLMRTMSTEPGFRGMMLTSMTPLSGATDLTNHFLDERSAEEVKDSRWYIMATWDDNPYLIPEEKKRLLAAMSPHEIEARTKGIPWIGSGLVYPIPETMITCDPFEIPKHWARVFAIDFGWTAPTAVLFAAYDRDNGKLYCYAEYYVSELTPQKHAVSLLNMGANWIPGVYDPAGRNSQQADGKTLVGMYRESGIQHIYPANNSKEEGVMKVLEMMQNGQLVIFNTLKQTLRERRMYSRDEKGVIKKGNDHLMDAMRYLVMSGRPIAVPQNYRDPSYYGMYGQSSAPSYI
jgi:phage terminase large subunit-like protein